MLDFLRKQMKWVMAIIVVAFLLSTFFMYEGRSTRRSPSVNADGTMTDYEVAQINGRSLMRSELEQRTRNYLETLGTRNTASLDMAAIYKSVLDQAVLESQLVKEIDDQGIRVSDAEAEQAMKTYADTYYPTRETFYQALANSGIKLEDYKRNLARQIAVDHLMSNAIGEIEISEDKAVEFYDSMKNLFYRQPEGFMVHMADFKTSEDAEAFRAKIVSGASWDVIASEDKNNESSDIVNITKQPVFLPDSALKMGTLSVMASLDVSEPSPVFAVSSNDFAVGMKTSHVDESIKPYEEVSGDIKGILYQEEQRKRLADYEENLKNKAQLVINDNELFTSPVVSEDEEPEQEIVIEEASEDVKPEVKEEVKSEDVKAEPEVKEEAKTEEVKTEIKSEDSAPVVEAVKEETVEEVKADEPKTETPAVEEAKEELKEEVKSEDSAPAVETETVKEEVKEEPKPEAEAKEEAKVEEVKTESETPAVEETKVELTEEIKSEDSAPAPAVEEVKEEVKEAVSEEVKEEAEAVSNMTESLDAVLEIPLGTNKN